MIHPILWLVTRFQRRCSHPSERIEKRSVGTLHEVWWCTRCGAQAILLSHAYKYVRIYPASAIEDRNRIPRDVPRDIL
jgi:hypothetical protein